MAKIKKVVEEDIENTDRKVSVYEVGYIVVPSIAEENLGREVTILKDALLEKGAIFISDEYPKMMELAYEMSRSIDNKKQKFTYGYFGWVKFETTTDNIKNIKDYLDKNENLVRYLITTTVRGNTMSTKRVYGKQEGTKHRTTTKVEVEKIDEETIDKEIEALVVE